MVPALLRSEPPGLPAVLGPEDLLAAFLGSLCARTRQAYDGDLRDFARHLGAPTPQAAVGYLLGGGPGPANLAALEYRIAMTTRGLAPKTIARRLAALRSVVKLARTLDRVTWCLEVSAPQTEAYRDTSGPGSGGWRRMLHWIRDRAVGGARKPVRDHAIVRLLHDLALRRGEVVGLDLADVDFEGQVPAAVWILGKGRAERERLTLAPLTAEALAVWLHLRGAAPGPLFGPLDRLHRQPCERLTGHSVARIVHGIARDCGLSRPVAPHALRHQSITEALDRTGGDLRRVQRFSRHKDIKTLMIYDDHRRDEAGDVSRLVADE